MRKPNLPKLRIPQFGQQIKTNIVAIISLLTALSGLFYNSWRDHQNELNQNHRNAAFEVLKNLGELQTIVNYAHFKADNQRGNPIEGWKYVLLVRDLSRLLPQTNMQQGDKLYMTWQQHWETLQTNSRSEQLISTHIANARADVLHTIDTLQ
jgi:hypothetical protein